MLPLQPFKDHIRSNALFAGGQKILLAVSGGKDSVLMAHLFKQSGFHFGIAHCNFNLRADESQRDESFVRMLAATLEVPFHVTQFQTKAYAATNKISTQMAARTLRYTWFEDIRNTQGYDFIALAQHQDDAMETILLNLTRGTGIAGLHGILPKRGKLIRPLLFLSRAEIDQFAEANHLDYVEDSSNLGSKYARNKIRHHVIPVLKALNPNVEHTFQQNIQRFAETEMVLRQTVSRLKQELLVKEENTLRMSIKAVRALMPQHLLMFELLRPFGFSETVVAELLNALDKQSGTSFYSAAYRIIVDREDLILYPLDNPADDPIRFIHQHDQNIELKYHHLQISYMAQAFF
ncbi:MAG TPA: tRNA lysidine(34) synthetase TilS, partial [Pedobacter sp.]|nr:tRNA lysidine(34) synthetase TilS [Pedobacter sp.]